MHRPPTRSDRHMVGAEWMMRAPSVFRRCEEGVSNVHAVYRYLYPQRQYCARSLTRIRWTAQHSECAQCLSMRTTRRSGSQRGHRRCTLSTAHEWQGPNTAWVAGGHAAMVRHLTTRRRSLTRRFQARQGLERWKGKKSWGQRHGPNGVSAMLVWATRCRMRMQRGN